MFNKDNTVEEEPAFAMMGFSRCQCSGEGMSLYGSNLKHSTIIKMTLSHSSRERGLSKNWFVGNDTIAEVEMSQNQFSEMITSMNIGSGVPVTLTYTEKDGQIEPPSFDSVVDQHKTEFAKNSERVIGNSEELLAKAVDILAGGGSLKKAAREELLRDIQKLVQDVESNLPFMEKQFNRAMDDTITDAKASIEAFHQKRVTDAGLTALSESAGTAPRLIEGDSKVKS